MLQLVYFLLILFSNTIKKDIISLSCAFLPCTCISEEVILNFCQAFHVYDEEKDVLLVLQVPPYGHAHEPDELILGAAPRPQQHQGQRPYQAEGGKHRIVVLANLGPDSSVHIQCHLGDPTLQDLGVEGMKRHN